MKGGPTQEVGCVVECNQRPCVPFGVEEQDGAVVRVFLPLPSGPALKMHTSGSSCHSEWLVIFYLMDVVYTVICAPPPILLESDPLNNVVSQQPKLFALLCFKESGRGPSATCLLPAQ